MRNECARIVSNKALNKSVYEMILEFESPLSFVPGQFVELKHHDFYLRRPISICDVNGKKLTLLYKVVGRGTDAMSSMQKDETLEVLYPCGNGFDLEKMQNEITLVGGGIGIPPLYYLAKCLKQQGKKARIILGYRNVEELFYVKEFEELGYEVVVCTDDGSYGKHGFVTSEIQPNDYIASVGPMGMLQGVHKLVHQGQYSLEARMGCGFGACMGCSIKTKIGYQRVCKEGPVFDQEVLPW